MLAHSRANTSPIDAGEIAGRDIKRHELLTEGGYEMQRERVDTTPELLPRVEERPLPPVGETIAVRPDVQDVEHTTQVVAPRDRIRWGPIWAGLLTVLAAFLLLSMLAIAIGAQTVEPGVTSAGTVATTAAWRPLGSC